MAVDMGDTMSQGMDGSGPDSQMPDDGSQGYMICITVDAQGALSVSKEPMDQEEMGESSGQQVGSIAEALKAALQIYQGATNGDARSQLQAGFDGSGGPPMKKKPMMGQPM